MFACLGNFAVSLFPVFELCLTTCIDFVPLRQAVCVNSTVIAIACVHMHVYKLCVQ